MVLALLITTTGCKMSDGERREPINVGEYIAQNVIGNYGEILSEVDRALIADWYLSTDDEALRKEICQRLLHHSDYEILFENDTVSIIYRYIYKPREEERVVVVDQYTTDGKLLSEGGEWSPTYRLAYDRKIKSNDEGGYAITSVKGGNNARQVECNLNISNVELDTKYGIRYDVDGSLSESYLNPEAEYNEYLSYDSEITETLERITENTSLIRFNSGAIHAVLNDKRDNKCDEIDIRFKKQRSAEVTYMGVGGSITY